MAAILCYMYRLKNIRMIKLCIIKACYLKDNLPEYRSETLDFIYKPVTNFLR